MAQRAFAHPAGVMLLGVTAVSACQWIVGGPFDVHARPPDEMGQPEGGSGAGTGGDATAGGDAGSTGTAGTAGGEDGGAAGASGASAAAGAAGAEPVCTTGGCVAPPSCVDLAADCGADAESDCCTSLEIPGGDYDRENDPEHPAHVSAFALDKYEVTVGRFRKFVDGYPANKPQPGDGLHWNWNNVEYTGWQSAWTAYLPEDQQALKNAVRSCYIPRSFTVDPGAYENRPVSCVSWYVAFAFCAWDGGRLPTQNEWNYVAAGGSQQRAYPWVEPGDDVTIDASRASYDCALLQEGDCTSVETTLLVVGSKPAGNGRWGHADLAGNVWEWTLDSNLNETTFCDDCAITAEESSHRVLWGGGFPTIASEVHTYSLYLFDAVGGPFEADSGFRCARDP